jgi:predicted transcriptional regulator
MRSIHFGDWLKRQIEDRLKTQSQFAQESQIPFFTLRHWIKSSSPKIRGLGRSKLAKALDLTREEVDKLLKGKV